MLPRVVRGLGQVKPAGAGQELAKSAFFQQISGRVPLLLADGDEVIVGLAAAAGRENKWMRQTIGNGGGRRAVTGHETKTVEVAIGRPGGIGTLAARTDEHGFYPLFSRFWLSRLNRKRLNFFLGGFGRGNWNRSTMPPN